MNLKTLLTTVFVVGVYFGSTWFFYGSSHPCEILIVRQRDHYMALAEKHHREDVESWQQYAKKTFADQEYGRFTSNVEEYSNASGRQENVDSSVMAKLREKVRKMTPAQCAWQAITWDSQS